MLWLLAIGVLIVHLVTMIRYRSGRAPRHLAWLSLSCVLIFLGVILIPEYFSWTLKHSLFSALLLFLTSVTVANGQRDADIRHLRSRLG